VQKRRVGPKLIYVGLNGLQRTLRRDFEHLREVPLVSMSQRMLHNEVFLSLSLRTSRLGHFNEAVSMRLQSPMQPIPLHTRLLQHWIQTCLQCSASLKVLHLLPILRLDLFFGTVFVCLTDTVVWHHSASVARIATQVSVEVAYFKVALLAFRRLILDAVRLD
jgi:hypothetical protein